MKIILSGYGKMGRELEKVALQRGHQVLEKLDTPADWMTRISLISQADVILEFSTPDSVLGNIRRCFDLHLPIVVGTTGWRQHTDLVKGWCKDEKQALFTASNFSIGVNILYNLTGRLSAMLNRFENYEITLEEIHHIHKLDSPSGTAVNLAEIILDGMDRKKLWVNRRQHNPEELEIISVREDEVPGVHIIHCESDADRLILKHEAKGRQGFAIGAVLASEWIIGKQGYFEMKDLLNLAD
ncbi:MAG: 4-hydroxy-tetrahydrodipicolinate reductase [Bacteroidales bacterium]|nr:4-hydroxy-tetrahydrodipicolinate reductase [Bacteroidales bacterium]